MEADGEATAVGTSLPDRVAEGTPEVKGTSEAELAPGKTVPFVPGATVVLPGFRTESMTWTTPFATRTLGMITLAWLTKTEPLATVTVIEPPPSVLTVVFLRSVL